MLHWLCSLYGKFLKTQAEIQTKADFTTPENSGSYFMQVLPVSRIHSICQQMLGNFLETTVPLWKAEAALLRVSSRGSLAVTCLAPSSLHTRNFVCCWSQFPPLGDDRSQHWVAPHLGHFVPFCGHHAALKANRNWLRHGPASGTGCHQHPAELGWGSLQKPQRGSAAAVRVQHTRLGSTGQREKLKSTVVRRWGTVITARERKEEPEIWHEIVSLKVGSWERFLQEAQMGARLLEHLPVCRGWQNIVKHPTLASSPWQALQQK